MSDENKTYVITEIEPVLSKYGGHAYCVLIKEDDTKYTYKTWISSRYRNYKNWKHIIENRLIGTVIKNIKVLHSGIINADSMPIIVSEKEKINGLFDKEEDKNEQR